MLVAVEKLNANYHQRNQDQLKVFIELLYVGLVRARQIGGIQPGLHCAVLHYDPLSFEASVFAVVNIYTVISTVCRKNGSLDVLNARSVMDLIGPVQGTSRNRHYAGF